MPVTQIFAQLRLCMAVPSYLREVYQDRELGSSVEYIQYVSRLNLGTQTYNLESPD